MGETSKLTFLWLLAWVLTGILRDGLWEFLILHAGPASEKTNFVPFLGYWGCFLASLLFGVRQLRHSTFQIWRWSWCAIAGISFLIVNNIAGASINYVAHVEAGPLLYSIFHSSVALLVALLGVFWLRVHVTPVQWLGLVLISGSVLATSVPAPLKARGSFIFGLVSALAANVFHALQFPVAQQILASDGDAKPSVASLAFFESLLGTLIFTAWTLMYTVPSWNESVVEPIHNSPQPSVALACFGYVSYVVVEGIHTVSFYSSIQHVGVVAVAVAKGLIAAGSFVFVHICFCKADHTQCVTLSDSSFTAWETWQKPMAIILSLLGVFIYSLGKAKKVAPGDVEGNEYVLTPQATLPLSRKVEQEPV
jgi:drug/metabolite transporter (DMT)-like permease